MPSQLSVSFANSSENSATSARIILVHEKAGVLGRLSASLLLLIETARSDAEFTAKSGTFLPLFTAEGAVLLAGIGSGLSAGTDAENWGGKLYAQLKKPPFTSAIFPADEMAADIIMSVGFGAVSAGYHFPLYRTKDEPKKIEAHISFIAEAADELTTLWSDMQALLEGVFCARDLVYEPANILYPTEFAARCLALKSSGLDVEVLDEAKLEELGMGALLGVGQGSARDSAVVIMHWNGGGTEAPVALVGKGVCFDTGGISLKPAKGMEDMKWDMGGAAAVTGAMLALAGRKVKRNVIGILGLVENMPDGNAQRPGDVVTSLSGQTVEIINTDAEGRLVLADIMTYVQDHYKPQAMIDLATLTGAILVALGKEYAGLFSNNDSLSAQIMKAGDAREEKSWRMPIGKPYHDMLKSHIADMKHIGGPYGGSSSAACFLEKFVTNKTPWAHLDIAGKAWSEKARPTVPTGGTGYGVRLLNKVIDDWQTPAKDVSDS